MAHDRGCEITEIQPHTVTIEQKERNSILLVQHREQVSLEIRWSGLGPVFRPVFGLVRGKV
jgi:hypothetical protein